MSWDEVLGELGAVFQDIGAVMVYLDPGRMTYNWLTESPLTSHVFGELDKFTGGMLTTAVNLSDLPGRAMRGDPISKYELIKDALLIITIVAIIFTGPVGLGILLGTMVGREVCSKQTEARDACMVAFQIVGAAAGSWASAATGITWGGASAAAEGAAEQAAWEAGPEAYEAYWLNIAEQEALASTTDFLPHLLKAGENYLVSRGIDEISHEAVELCKEGNWVGSHECEILGQVAADYIKSPDDIAWEDFLAREVAVIGVQELMLQWFPPDSKEAIAIQQRQWEIKYVDGGVVTQNNVIQKKFDPKTLMLLAGGALVLLAGAST